MLNLNGVGVTTQKSNVLEGNVLVVPQQVEGKRVRFQIGKEVAQMLGLNLDGNDRVFFSNQDGNLSLINVNDLEVPKSQTMEVRVSDLTFAKASVLASISNLFGTGEYTATKFDNDVAPCVILNRVLVNATPSNEDYVADSDPTTENGQDFEQTSITEDSDVAENSFA